MAALAVSNLGSRSVGDGARSTVTHRQGSWFQFHFLSFSLCVSVCVCAFHGRSTGLTKRHEQGSSLDSTWSITRAPVWLLGHSSKVHRIRDGATGYSTTTPTTSDCVHVQGIRHCALFPPKTRAPTLQVGTGLVQVHGALARRPAHGTKTAALWLLQD